MDIKTHYGYYVDYRIFSKHHKTKHEEIRFNSLECAVDFACNTKTSSDSIVHIKQYMTHCLRGYIFSPYVRSFGLYLVPDSITIDRLNNVNKYEIETQGDALYLNNHNKISLIENIVNSWKKWIKKEGIIFKEEGII